MDWFTTCQQYYNSGFYTATQLKVFVSKGKITADQFQQITGQTYTA